MLLIFILLIIVFISSFLLSRYFCVSRTRWTPLDHPTSRSLHALPTPRTGGLAIFLSLFLGFLILFIVLKLGFYTFLFKGIIFKKLLWILGMFALIFAVSLWDDKKSLSPIIRLGIHLTASFGIVWGGGLTIEHLNFPYLGFFSLGHLSTPITILLILWMTNLYNFMDGMDGFAGGMTIFGFSLLGYFFLRKENIGLAIVSSLTAASTGGFFIHNLPPARIFMGDVGSIPLGFLSSILIIAGIKENIFDIWLPTIIFSPFIIDSTVTVFKRLLNGKRIWIAHRDHYYQRLVLAGWGHYKTVIAEYFLMTISGLLAFFYANAEEMWKLIILLFLFLIYTFLIFTISVLHNYSNSYSKETY